ncbi:MAG TPA: D-glucuronyl C5-epimerase family protein [Ktedonobacterales bacterium]
MILSRLPVIRQALSEARSLRSERAKPRFGLARVRLDASAALPFPIDMGPLLGLPFGRLDERGVPYNTTNGAHGGAYQPTSIAQYGLAQWNAWLEDHDPARLPAFFAQADWLLENERRMASGAGVWPIPFPSPGYGASGPWLSALTQGNAISVLMRAYHQSGDVRYLESARRAVRSFEMDIFEGGVSAPVADGGIFFEEVATYPAARILNGYVLALLGLLDYTRVTRDEDIERLARRSIDTLHDLLPGYDLGYWSSYDLLYRRPASRFYHALHIALLRALAEYTSCEQCASLAARWEKYQKSHWNRARYYITSRARRYQAKFTAQRAARARSAAAKAPDWDGRARALASITGFPIAGGMRGVLVGVGEVMQSEWKLEYLTRAVGADRARYAIHAFVRKYRLLGREATSPSHYPNVALYQREGQRILTRLMRTRGYTLALPQDGAFTAAYTGPVARRYGARVVTMDHGNVTLPDSEFFKAQRDAEYTRRRQPRRAIERLRFRLYLRALRRLIRRAVESSDTFLVAGDEVQDTYVRQYGVSPGLIVRYPYWVDAERFEPLPGQDRLALRNRLGLSAGAVLITLISRLTDEKGFDVALNAIAAALALAGPDEAARCGVLIAGSGPLRPQIEADIRRLGLGDVTKLWGEASRDDVVELLRASDIFLYAGKRGTNYSMAVLEAMAAGCAVVATSAPISNARLLADGRGVALTSPASADQMAGALARLIQHDDLRRQMGHEARLYIQRRHSASALRQALWRATGWAPSLDAYLLPAPDSQRQTERPSTTR